MPVVLVKLLPSWPLPQGKMLWTGWCQLSLWNFCHHDLPHREKCCGQDFFLPCFDKPEMDLNFFKKPNQKLPPPGFSVNSGLKAWLPAMVKMSWFFSWVILYVTHHTCLATYLNTASSFSFNTWRKKLLSSTSHSNCQCFYFIHCLNNVLLPLWKIVAHGLKSLFLKLTLTFHSQTLFLVPLH